MNWHGKPLTSIAAMISLIASTKTLTGLKIACVVDERTYPDGVKVSDEELDAVNLVKSEFHGEWNYTIFPSN
jgi:hypothetical protein